MPTRARVRVGLRARVVIALVATSLATLAGATLFLVPPLSARLERDQVQSVRPAIRAAARTLRELPARDLRTGSPAVGSVLFELERQSGGRTTLFDAAGRVVGAFPRGPGAPGGPGGAGDPGAGGTGDPLGATGPGGVPFTRGGSGPPFPADRRAPDLVERVDDDVVTVRQVVRVAGARTLVLVVRKPLRESRAAVAVVRRSVPAAGLIGLAVAILLAAVLSTSLLRRLRLLQDDARALGEEGLGHPVRVGPGDEVGEVAAALEAMRVRLVEEERLRQAFLATASHELRTPLAGLLGTLELLREEVGEAPDDDGLRRRADVALERTRRLVDLSGELLHLSRLDAGESVDVAPLDLTAVVRAATDGVGDLLRGDARELEIEDPGPVPARADAAAVARIVENLLENARRYGRGTVRVAVQDGDRATVRVSDEGPGIDAEDRERIFRRFERGSAAWGAGSGFGLGLAIARDLARRMDGDLQIDPGAPTTTFVLSVPADDEGRLISLRDDATW